MMRSFELIVKANWLVTGSLAVLIASCSEGTGSPDGDDGGETDTVEETGEDVEVEWGESCEEDADCNDRVDCTVDTCDWGNCTNTPDDTVCDDGLQCDGDEICHMRDGCISGDTFTGCSDYDPCTMDQCYEGAPGMAFTCLHPPLDRDADGYVDDHCGGIDCNDLNALVYPDAGERCFDGLDNDCDLLVDAEDPVDCALSNDGCDDARTVEPGETVEGFTIGAIGDVRSGCDSDSYQDVVYTFTLADEQDVEIRVTGRDGFYPYVSLQSACGDTTSTISCQAESPFHAFYRALPAGDYWVVVSSWTEGVFDLVVDASEPSDPPPGDTCDDAIDVSGGGTFPGDLFYASHDVTLSCASWASYADLIYTFTITGARDVHVRASSPLFSIYASLVEDCGNPSVSIDCGSDYPFERTWGALPAGTYYFIVETYSPGEFTLEVDFSAPSAPPTNDACPGATDVSDGGAFHGTLVSASDDGDSSCMSSTSIDAAYTFTIDEPQDVLVDLDGVGDYYVYWALQTSCGVPSTDLRCITTTPSTTLVRSLPAGQYWILVESSYQGPFNLEVTFSAPTTACDGIAMIDHSGSFPGNTTGRPNDFESSGCGGSATGPDQAYLLRLAVDSDVLAATTSAASGYDTVMHLRSACDDVGSEIQCDDDGYGYPLSQIEQTALPAGDYILIVDGWGWYSYGTYTLDVEITPVAPPADPDGSDASDA